jgi:ribosomal-protein-alanine N-acetyltransferase
MKSSDLDQVVRIEKKSFSSPWTADSFKKELEDNPYANYLVGQIGRKVIGYVGSWIIASESHITTLAVAPAYRRQRVARRLLFELFNRFMKQGVKRITLEVRISNDPARQLYREYGFKEVGIREKYYQDNQEDAIIMWRTLN